MRITPNPVALAVGLAALFLCASIAFIGSTSPPIDTTVSNLAFSASGKRLAAGTTQGRITVWDQSRPDAPQQLAFPHGSLNDLHFSPDERLLAIASRNLAIYTPAESAGPRIFRGDHANDGSADALRTAGSSW